MDVKFLKRSLAWRQIEIYRAHDALEFLKLSSIAESIYRDLGADIHVARRCGLLLAQAYAASDIAAEAAGRDELLAEAAAYGKAGALLSEIGELLALPSHVARHQIGWWVAVRHKRRAAAISHLYNQHKGVHGWVSSWRVPWMAYDLVRVGQAHDRRDWGAAIRMAEFYWQHVLSAYRTMPPFLG